MSFVTDRLPRSRSTIEITLPEIEYVKSAWVSACRRTIALVPQLVHIVQEIPA